MKLTCDVCGHELRPNAGGAICPNCGMEYGQDRLQEKNPKKRNLTLMWIILVIIGLYAFFGALFSEPGRQEGTVYLTSLAALLITLFIFRPWKTEGK